MSEVLTQSIEDDILILTLNRPKALNALNKEIMNGLFALFVENDIEHLKPKGVIITGAGEKAFVAGADIKEFTQLSRLEASALSRRGHAIFNAIESYSIPVIAAINGFALGGGCELAMACHLRFAAEEAKFGLPEVTLGLIPGYGGTQRLPQLIGKGRALELILSGKMIDSATALQFGLVNRVFPADQLLTKATKWIQRTASNAPVALDHAIQTINSAFNTQKNGFEEEINAFGYLTETQDFKEGVSAFLEKRKPEFKGE